MLTVPVLGELSPYWIGVLGSVAVEAAAAARSCAEIEGRCPERYKRAPFWFFRTILALVGGTLPVVLDANNAITAFWLGGSAPLVLDRLSRGISPSNTNFGEDEATKPEVASAKTVAAR